MADLPRLQALVCEMYLHTSQGATTRRHASLAASAQRVREAPCLKKSPREIERGAIHVQGMIIDDLLNGEVPVEILKEKLQKWEGARVK